MAQGSVGGGGGSSAGSVNTKRAPPPSRFSARIVPRCASTIARQIARPRPTPGIADSGWPRVNFSKIARLAARRQSRSAIVDRDFDRSRPATCASIRIGDPGRRVLGGVLEQVARARARSARASQLTSGRSAGNATSTGRPASAGSSARNRAADDLLERLPVLPQLRTSPASRRAMSSRLSTSCAHPPRLVADRGRFRLAGTGPRFARELLRERLGQADQRRQRRAQVVRERRQQRIAQPLGLHLDERPLRDTST